MVEVRLSEGFCPLHSQQHLGEQGFCVVCEAGWTLKRATLKVTMRRSADLDIESSITWDLRDVIRWNDPDEVFTEALVRLADINSKIKLDPSYGLRGSSS